MEHGFELAFQYDKVPNLKEITNNIEKEFKKYKTGDYSMKDIHNIKITKDCNVYIDEKPMDNILDLNVHFSGDFGRVAEVVIKTDAKVELESQAIIKVIKERTQLNFGDAIAVLKSRAKVARKGWNGKGMYLTLIPAGNSMWQGYPMQDCIGLKTADNKMQPGWVPSQVDMLAEDWEVVE